MTITGGPVGPVSHVRKERYLLINSSWPSLDKAKDMSWVGQNIVLFNESTFWVKIGTMLCYQKT